MEEGPPFHNTCKARSEAVASFIPRVRVRREGRREREREKAGEAMLGPAERAEGGGEKEGGRTTSRIQMQKVK